MTAFSLYYLGTPLFALIDLAIGLPVRAVGLASPAWRLGYYGLSFGLGWIMIARPVLAPWLAMAESAGNLTLLLASVLIPVWSMAENLDVAAVEDLPARVLNLAISGSVLVYAFYRSQAQLAGRARR